MKILRTLIAEDEVLAREGLSAWVQDSPQLQLLGCVGDGDQALHAIRTQAPDLVLMDIQMPGLTGLQVLRILGQEAAGTLPAVIFTTAYDEHALTAFELHAVDYLLKPFSRERFDEAIAHLSRDQEGGQRSLEALEAASTQHLRPEPLRRLMVRDMGRIIPLQVEHIEHLRSDTKYTAIVAQGRTHLVRLPISHFAERLDPQRFLKVNRSCIVNLDCVEAPGARRILAARRASARRQPLHRQPRGLQTTAGGFLMKALLTLSLTLALALTSAGSMAQDAPPGKLYSPGAFDSLSFTGSALVRLLQGERDEVFVEGDEAVQREVYLVLRGNQLTVRTTGSWMFWRAAERLRLQVTARNLRQISISGAAQLHAPEPFHVDELEIDISGSGLVRFDQLQARALNFHVNGSGDAQLSGSTDALDIRASGRSDVQAEHLLARQAKVRYSGVGKAKLWVQDTLDVRITGIRLGGLLGRAAAAAQGAGPGRREGQGPQREQGQQALGPRIGLSAPRPGPPAAAPSKPPPRDKSHWPAAPPTRVRATRPRRSSGPSWSRPGA